MSMAVHTINPAFGKTRQSDFEFGLRVSCQDGACRGWGLPSGEFHVSQGSGMHLIQPTEKSLALGICPCLRHNLAL